MTQLCIIKNKKLYSMEKVPTIKSYGEYSSENYGVNSLLVSFPCGLRLFYSYTTIIAFCGNGGELFVRKNDWGNTTGKHLNFINRDKKLRIDGKVFEKLLEVELLKHNLL
jgi:hypothetical protein